jgi:hypothetical protein
LYVCFPIISSYKYTNLAQLAVAPSIPFFVV